MIATHGAGVRVDGELPRREAAGKILPAVGWNAVAQAMPVVTTVVATPFLLARLGVEGYGIWVVASTVLTLATSLDGGVGVSLARFFALHHTADDRPAAARLVATAACLAAAVGAVVTVLAYASATFIVRILHVSAAQSANAVAVVHQLGVLASLVLLSAAFFAVLQGHGRFRGVAAVNGLASIAYLLTLFSLVGSHGLGGVVHATEIQLSTSILISASLVRRHVLPRGRLIVTGAEAKALWQYSTRMQITLLTTLLNTEADALIVSAVVGVRAAAMFGLGYQAAMAVRVLPLWALAPVFTRLSARFGRDGDAGLVEEHDQLNRTWQPLVAGYCTVGAIAAGFGVHEWLGPAYDRAAVVAVVLCAGYTVNLVVTGVTSLAVRAGGRPGIEARYAVVGAAINLVLTVPGALMFGLYGVVGATAAGTAIGSFALPWLIRRNHVELRGLLRRPPLTTVLAAAALTVAGEMAVVSVPGHGLARLLLAGVPAVAGLAVLAASFGGLRSRPVGARPTVAPVGPG